MFHAAIGAEIGCERLAAYLRLRLRRHRDKYASPKAFRAARFVVGCRIAARSRRPFARCEAEGKLSNSSWAARQVVEPRTYPLRVSSATKIMVPGLLALFTLVGFIIPFAEPSTGSAPPAIFAVFWLGFLAFAWYQVLSLPQAIVHHPDDRLEFRSMTRKRFVAIRDLKVIEPVPNQFGFFRFRHSNGKIVALIHFDGFHELLAEIKARNPDVLLLGC